MTGTNMTVIKTLRLIPASDIWHPAVLVKGRPLAQMQPSSTLIWIAERKNNMLFIVLLIDTAAGLVPLCQHMHSGGEKDAQTENPHSPECV